VLQQCPPTRVRAIEEHDRCAEKSAVVQKEAQALIAARSSTLRVFLVLSVAGLIAASSTPTPVQGAPNLRVQVNQHGDFVLIGNALGQECLSGTPAPVVGTVGACGTNTADSSPDVFWRADSPSNGMAEANTGIAVAQARSSAVLSLPVGAQVTHAYLYYAEYLHRDD
jgi:hypothetical protein